jgi:hypothetical protein
MTYPKRVRIINPYQFNQHQIVEPKSLSDWQGWLRTIEANGYKVVILETA